MAREHLSPAEVAGIVRVAASALDLHAEGLNLIDVFPEPNGDTGTNLAATMGALADAVEAVPLTMTAMSRAVDSASADCGQGRSGRLVAQLMAGLFEAFRNHDAVDGTRLALGLELGAERARASVSKPTDGTILTVAEAAAAAALTAADAGGDVGQVGAAAVEAALEALEATPSQLDALRVEGVVDAGGAGWVVVLEMIAGQAEALGVARGGDHVGATRPTPTWEVMLILEADEAGAALLRSRWAELGENVGVAGGADGQWRSHVHTCDIGAAIEAAIDCGRPREVRVEELG